MTAATVVSRMESKQKADSSSSPEDPDTHMDRNSAIALSIILFLVLVAITWYLRLHFAQKRQADQSDLERQLQASEGHFNSATGRVTWNRQSSCCSEEAGRARPGSLFRLKSAMAKKDSLATCSLGDSPGTSPGHGDGEKRKWPGLSQWRMQDSTTTSTLGPNAFAMPENTLPLTSTERPCPTRSRRQSQRGFFDPLPLHNPLHHTPARRPSSSLSQDAYDKRWWNEVARRGSTTNSTRPSSVLDAVPEPEVRGHAGGTRAAGRSSTVSRDHGRGSTDSAHASWRGSRCESVMYDWTRPTDAQVQAKNEMNFGGVIWDGHRNGRDSNEREKIQSMDWALKM